MVGGGIHPPLLGGELHATTYHLQSIYVSGIWSYDLGLLNNPALTDQRALQELVSKYMILSLLKRSTSKVRFHSTMAPINVKVAANDFLDFVDASPTPFHAVKSVKDRLTKVGFKEIKVRPYHPVSTA